MKIKKGFIIYIVISVWAVYTAAKYHYTHTFSQKAWLKTEERAYMAEDMMKKYSLEGMTKEDVISLLGNDTEREYFKEKGNLVYWLGCERGFISIDSEWLVINFKEEKVSNYYITRD